MKRDGRADAGHIVFVQRPSHSIDRGAPRGADGDYLGDERIVVGRYDVTGVSVRIDPHPAAAGRVIKHDPARRRLEIFGRILGVDPALDGVQARCGMRDVWRERLTGRDADLFLHQIAAVNLLRDRVFDLQPGVHLHEIKMSIFADQKFNGAGILVAD